MTQPAECRVLEGRGDAGGQRHCADLGNWVPWLHPWYLTRLCAPRRLFAPLRSEGVQQIARWRGGFNGFAFRLPPVMM